MRSQITISYKFSYIVVCAVCMSMYVCTRDGIQKKYNNHKIDSGGPEDFVPKLRTKSIFKFPPPLVLYLSASAPSSKSCNQYNIYFHESIKLLIHTI